MTARLRRRVTASCHHDEHLGHTIVTEGGNFQLRHTTTQTVCGEEEAAEAAGGSQEKHSREMELFVPRAWDRKVAASPQPGDMCPTAALQGSGHPACPALPGPHMARIHQWGQADMLVSQLGVNGGTLHCPLPVTKVAG